ncbi:hypothetical protein J6590_089622 [Homalodisca vitripennis]|nr:hypothetical protein J6590_089622 [Homalodisca vitripennis]
MTGNDNSAPKSQRPSSAGCDHPILPLHEELVALPPLILSNALVAITPFCRCMRSTLHETGSNSSASSGQWLKEGGSAIPRYTFQLEVDITSKK